MNRVEVVVDRNRQPLTECEGFPAEQAPIVFGNIVLIRDGIRHKYHTEFGLSFFFHSEKHDSTIEVYRAQLGDQFTIRWPEKAMQERR